MKKLRLTLTIAGVLAMSAPISILADTNTVVPAAKPAEAIAHPQTNPDLKALRAKQAEREEQFHKSLGINLEEYKALSPADKRAKRKEAIDNKIQELSKKKADGSLSKPEEQMLTRLQRMQKAADAPHLNGQRKNAGKVPADAKPIEDKK